MGTRQRCFNKEWYKTYHWLEYSRKDNAIYCQPCRFFGIGTSVFVKTGFSNWKKATGKDGALLKHQRSVSHRNAIVAFREYQLTKKHDSSIANQLNRQRK